MLMITFSPLLWGLVVQTCDGGHEVNDEIMHSGNVCICPRVSSLLSLTCRFPVHYSSVVFLVASPHFQLVLLARWYIIIRFKQLPVRSNDPDALQNPSLTSHLEICLTWVSFAPMFVPYALLTEAAGDQID